MANTDSKSINDLVAEVRKVNESISGLTKLIQYGYLGDKIIGSMMDKRDDRNFPIGKSSSDREPKNGSYQGIFNKSTWRAAREQVYDPLNGSIGARLIRFLVPQQNKPVESFKERIEKEKVKDREEEQPTFREHKSEQNATQEHTDRIKADMFRQYTIKSLDFNTFTQGKMLVGMVQLVANTNKLVEVAGKNHVLLKSIKESIVDKEMYFDGQRKSGGSVYGDGLRILSTLITAKGLGGLLGRSAKGGMLTTVGESAKRRSTAIINPSKRAPSKLDDQIVRQNISQKSNTAVTKPSDNLSTKSPVAKQLAYNPSNMVDVKEVPRITPKPKSGVGNLMSKIGSAGKMAGRVALRGGGLLTVGLMAAEAISNSYNQMTEYYEKKDVLNRDLINGAISKAQYDMILKKNASEGTSEVVGEAVETFVDGFAGLLGKIPLSIANQLGIIEEDTKEKWHTEIDNMTEKTGEFVKEWVKRSAASFIGYQLESGYENKAEYDQDKQRLSKLKQQVMDVEKQRDDLLKQLADPNTDPSDTDHLQLKIDRLNYQISTVKKQHDVTVAKMKDSGYYRSGDESFSPAKNASLDIMPQKDKQIEVERDRSKQTSTTNVNNTANSNVQVNNNNTTFQSGGVQVLNKNGPSSWSYRFQTDF